MLTLEQTGCEASATEPAVPRVMVVDDHPIVRTGLRLILERFGKMCLDCEAPDGPTAIQLAQERAPDLVLLDVRLSGRDGLETAVRLREVCPATRVILLSGWFGAGVLLRGLEIGVDGFVLKSEPPLQLVRLIRQALAGEFCCSPAVQQMLETTHQGHRVSSCDGVALAALSPQERNMLSCLAKGLSLKQAAHHLGVSYKSADHLKQDVMKKLAVHHRVDLVHFAIRTGLVE